LTRRLIWFAVAAGVAVLLSTLRMLQSYRPLPAIAATLTGNEADFTEEIDERIRELFPIGADEKRLIDYLKTEGFAPEWRQRDDVNAARFVRDGLLCQKTVRVLWRASATGVLTEVGASYFSRCF
jgi:hypothetical protein